MVLSTGKIFSIALSIYFVAALVPAALTLFFDTDTTGWDSATVALWALIPLAIVAVLVYAYMPRGSKDA